VKRCVTCGVEKPLDQFSVNHGRPRAECKPCRSARQRAYYAANRDSVQAREKARYWNNPEVREYQRVMSRRWYEDNKELANERSRAWYRANPDRVKRSNRATHLRRYNLTADDFAALLACQRGVCALCETSDPRGPGTWAIDHDHACCAAAGRSCGRCIRGLLCTACNWKLGVLENYVATGAAAVDGAVAAYLANPPWRQIERAA
jgi:hypothetical protein